MPEIEEDDARLTADEILLFGPVVEAQVWTPTFLAEKRAPIAAAAGRPRFGQVFNSDGVAKAALIRPCVSRGKRIRGLPPIYSPTMLEANAGVFAGWAMYFDHLSEAVAEALREMFSRVQIAERRSGRSVREMAGQVLTPYFDREFVQEGDADFGYQQGGVLSEVWGSPVLREIVGNNPDLLHTSIAAWPTSGKPGPVPWNPGVRGMAIEGIRRQPQGSVDFVPRGGAGGRLLLSEGADADTAPWPVPEWDATGERLVVSLAESFYADPAMGTSNGNAQTPDFSTMAPGDLRAWIAEHQAHLLPALSESHQTQPPQTSPALTEADVRRLLAEATASAPAAATADDVTQLAEDLIEEREQARHFSAIAGELIEAAEGIPAGWKKDLRERYAVRPTGAAPALLVEEETDGDGKQLSEEDVLRRNVLADLSHARDRIAEATGKPRVRGEGGGSSKASGVESKTPLRESKPDKPYWREQFAEMGIVESADAALAIHGVEKVGG